MPPPTHHINTYGGSQIQEKRGENHCSGDSTYQIKMILLMASEYKGKTDNCPLRVLWPTLQNEGEKINILKIKTKQIF